MTYQGLGMRRIAAWVASLWLLAASNGWAGGQLAINVVEEGKTGPVFCRMMIKNTGGKPFHPKKAVFWHDHFIVPGQIALQLPLGNYAFELERGPEYPVVYGRFEINNFADDSKQIKLTRHVDMAKAGWWSGDLDIRRPPTEAEPILMGEDLHVGMFSTWTAGVRPAAGKGPSAKPVCVDRNRFFSTAAGRCRLPGGTAFFFQMPEALPPFTVEGEFPALPLVFELARKQPGAWVDLGMPYCWDLPVLAALGQLQSVELAYEQIGRERVVADEAGGRPRDKMAYPGQWGNPRWSNDIYYHLLEAGFRVPPSAGSGSGESPNPAGYNRMYVHVDGEFAYDKWWENFKAGRVVVTNGPLLQPNVDGHAPGHTFQAEAGQPLEFDIGLTLSTREEISYLEVIKDGRVLHSIPFSQYCKGGQLPKVPFDRSGWFLVRAVTDNRKTYRYAMTAPYYVEVGYQPRISKKSAQFFLDWVFERAKQIKLDDPERQGRVMEYHRRARDFWQDRVKRANAE